MTIEIIINKAMSNAAHISAVTMNTDMITILERLSERQWERVITVPKAEGLQYIRKIDSKLIPGFQKIFYNKLSEQNRRNMALLDADTKEKYQKRNK